MLGIGLGASKGEGKALASRLTEMRNERNSRAKAATAAAKATAAPKIGGTNNPAGQLTFEGLGNDIMDDDGMQLITGSGGNTGSGSKNKSKKKKKKKTKKR